MAGRRRPSLFGRIIRRSSSVVPPQMPFSWFVSSANCRHALRTSHESHTAFAARITPVETPELPTGKNSSGLVNLQLARSRQPMSELLIGRDPMCSPITSAPYNRGSLDCQGSRPGRWSCSVRLLSRVLPHRPGRRSALPAWPRMCETARGASKMARGLLGGSNPGGASRAPCESRWGADFRNRHRSRSFQRRTGPNS
jgi:hypothetical protein